MFIPSKKRSPVKTNEEEKAGDSCAKPPSGFEPAFPNAKDRVNDFWRGDFSSLQRRCFAFNYCEATSQIYKGLWVSSPTESSACMKKCETLTQASGIEPHLLDLDMAQFVRGGSQSPQRHSRLRRLQLVSCILTVWDGRGLGWATTKKMVQKETAVQLGIGRESRPPQPRYSHRGLGPTLLMGAPRQQPSSYCEKKTLSSLSGTPPEGIEPLLLDALQLGTDNELRRLPQRRRFIFNPVHSHNSNSTESELPWIVRKNVVIPDKIQDLSLFNLGPVSRVYARVVIGTEIEHTPNKMRKKNVLSTIYAPGGNQLRASSILPQLDYERVEFNRHKIFTLVSIENNACACFTM
ncbi:hypothetical protein DFH06DRAFT_1121434 [Mycena polygramma]|nr:hypothetical protein DFH06DRAFT_1121434 [Mycena polygramma]